MVAFHTLVEVATTAEAAIMVEAATAGDAGVATEEGEEEEEAGVADNHDLVGNFREFLVHLLKHRIIDISVTRAAHGVDSNQHNYILIVLPDLNSLLYLTVLCKCNHCIIGLSLSYMCWNSLGRRDV
ncbi:hypothetical protein FRC08_009258, partial [Ceratobasidium sp. 394]